jgi:hypothetical protein
MIQDYTTYSSLAAQAAQKINYTKASITTVQGRTFSLWTTAQDAGSTPTSSAVPTNATTGTLKQLDSALGLWLAQNEIDIASLGSIIIADRLVHNGGMSGIVVGSQTTNLPTSALTRYTSGSGVMAAIEIYTQIGATGTTVACSGVFSDGTTGFSTQTTIGNTGYREASRFIVLSLPAGKTGWKQITSVALAASTTTAGNFGVTLFKPIIMLNDPTTGSQMAYDAIIGGLGMGGLVPIPNTSALFYIVTSNAITSGIVQATHSFLETA